MSADSKQPSTAQPGTQAGSVKNPEHEAENPGGRPTEAVQGTSPGLKKDRAGQQGGYPPRPTKRE
jgi:hypothetical protein